MIGTFGLIPFYVSEFDVFSLKKELSRTRKAKITQHDPIYGLSKIRHQGRELIEVKLSIELIASLSSFPGTKLNLLKEMLELGVANYLIIGSHLIGEFPFIITAIDETLSHANLATGDFDYINLDITLLEYVEEPSLYEKKLESKKTAKLNYEKAYKNSIEAIQKKVLK